MSPTLRIAWAEGADPSLGLPVYASAGAAGADLRANLPPDLRSKGVTIGLMQRGLIPTGLCMEIPAGFEVQIRARSGLALRDGLVVANAPGTIDSDYRGPVGVILMNLGAAPYVVTHGARIAQIVVAPVVQARFAEGAPLSDSVRGAGGFGSTGRN